MTTNSAIQERIGNLGGIGVAKEATFGTPVLPTQFSDAMSTSLKPDPGLFSPSQMIGVRDSNVFPLYGQTKLQGSVDGMIVPTNAIEFLVASIGGDSGSNGTTGATLGITGTTSASGWNTTTIVGSGNLAAGSTTFTVLSATGMSTGQFMQFGTAGAPSGNVPEVRKITVSGTTITLDTATQFAHAQGVSGVTLQHVVTPFTHNLIEQNYLPSLTIEKNIGGYQSEQYAGCRMGKFTVKAPATNNPVTFTADIMAKAWTYLTSPTAISIVSNDAPFVFSEASLTLNATTIYETYNVNLTIDNKVAETWTNMANPQFITAQGLMVSGTFDAVFGSINDATIGFLNQVMTGVATAPLTLTLQHPAGNSIVLTCPTVQFNTDNVQIKPDTLITETIAFEAFYSLSSLATITGTVVNGVWLPY